MASVNIDVGSGVLLVYKNQVGKLDFTISDLVSDDSDIDTIAYSLTTISDDSNGTESSTIINMFDWKKINTIEDKDSMINVTGIPNLKYQYKVEFLNVDGTVLQVLSDYGDYYDTNKTFTTTFQTNLITTSKNSYKIKVTVKASNHKEFTSTRGVLVYNTPPTIIATVTNNKLIYSIGDSDNDLIRYRIKLNNEKIYPLNKDMTDFQQPLNDSIQIDSSRIILQQANSIEIYVEDKYGETNTFTYEFIGEYVGLLFTDVNGNYYSTDLGQVIKKLNFGKIKAGSRSDIKFVKILNKTGKDLNLINVTVNTNKLLTIWYGFNESNLISHASTLVFNGSLKDNENTNLYLQVTPNLEFSGENNTNKATFEINIIAPQNS